MGGERLLAALWRLVHSGRTLDESIRLALGALRERPHRPYHHCSHATVPDREQRSEKTARPSWECRGHTRPCCAHLCPLAGQRCWLGIPPNIWLARSGGAAAGGFSLD